LSQRPLAYEGIFAPKVNLAPPPALDREPVAAQDGLCQQATALLTLAFLSLKQVIAGDQAGAQRGGRISPSRLARRGAEGMVFVYQIDL